ncbi:hypothetical protein B7463_g869, partial [Scytalidium lignicola]
MKRLHSFLGLNRKPNDAIRVEALEVDASGSGAKQLRNRRDYQSRTALAIDSSSLNYDLERHAYANYGEERELSLSLHAIEIQSSPNYDLSTNTQEVRQERFVQLHSGHESHDQHPLSSQDTQTNPSRGQPSADEMADFLRRYQEMNSKLPPGALDGILRQVHNTKSTTDQIITAFDDRDEYGMFILRDKPSNRLGIVDVVAIHGLNGHYSRTWTSQRGSESANWLKDFLPTQLLNTRIMSFGYNSTVQFSKSDADISTFAEQLLEELLAVRCTQIEMHRPLVFICHSLGGIVFKKALIKAHEKRRYDQIKSCVYGVAFFGTPHRGAALASWSTILANVLSAATVGRNTNSRLSKSLKLNAQALLDISESFVDRGKGLQILSFYETDKMDFLDCKVVEKASAAVGLANEVLIPVNGNHRNICQFLRASEPRYRVVWTNIRDIVSKAVYVAKPLAEFEFAIDQDALLKRFWTSDYEAHRRRNPLRLPGTCEWLFHHPKYKQWLQDKSSSLLWLSANPGCGKSVFMSALVDDLRTRTGMPHDATSTCHFFFKNENAQQENAHIALRAILHQIFIDKPFLLKYAQKQFRTKGDDMFVKWDTLWMIFTDVVMDADAGNFVFVFDALDECEIKSQEYLRKALTDLHKQKGQFLVGRFFKTIIASRPDNAIQASFCDFSRLRAEDEADATTHDVDLVTKAKVKELIIQGVDKNEITRAERELISRADRTFLWTALTLELLVASVQQGANSRDIDRILQNDGLHDVYNQLLQSSFNPEEARIMLCLILAAARPFTLEEMNVAMAVHLGGTELSPLEPRLKSPIENYIKTTCGHFVRIIHGELSLVHQTAKEFLVSDVNPTSNEIRQWKNTFPSKACEDVLLDVCETYYRLVVFFIPKALDIPPKASPAIPRPDVRTYKNRLRLPLAFLNKGAGPWDSCWDAAFEAVRELTGAPGRDESIRSRERKLLINEWNT